MSDIVDLTPGKLTIEQLRALAQGGQQVRLDDGCWPGVEAAARVVEQAARGTAAVYGVNTGFGKLATTRIAQDQIEELQRRLVLSHMCGVGPPLADPVVRLILALKATSLALGHSGVQRRTIELLLELLNHDALPVIPAKGSVGASGDLAPLAHLAGCLIGQGEIRHAGETRPAAEVAAPDRRGAAAARRQGGPGAAQRHPGLDRAGARRLVRGRGDLRCRAARRRHERRRRARQRRAVRSAAQPGARPARPDPGRRAPARPARRQRDPRLAPGRLRARPGPLQPALPAAGHGRLPRPARRPPAPRWCARRTASPTTRWCSRRRARRGPARSSRAATSTPSRSPSRPIRSRSRWPRSARSPSAGSRC